MSDKLTILYPNDDVFSKQCGHFVKIIEGRINLYLEITGKSGNCETYFLGTMVRGNYFKRYEPLVVEGSFELNLRLVVEMPSVVESVSIDQWVISKDILSVIGHTYSNTSGYDPSTPLLLFVYKILQHNFLHDLSFKQMEARQVNREIRALAHRIGDSTGFTVNPVFSDPASNLEQKVDDSGSLASAVSFLLNYYNIRTYTELDSLNDESKDFHERLQVFVNLSRIRIRKVRLPQNFIGYTSMNPLLAFYRQNDVVKPVILNLNYSFCEYTDPISGKKCKVGPHQQDNFEEFAYQFYPTWMVHKSNLSGLLKFVFANISGVKRLLLLFLVVSFLFCIVSPTAIYHVIATVIPTGNEMELFYFSVILVILGVCGACIKLFPEFVLQVYNSSQYENLQSAVFDRILSMPVSSLEKFDSGDLVARVLSVEPLKDSIYKCFMGVLKVISFGGAGLTVMLFLDLNLTLAAVVISALMVLVLIIVGYKYSPLVMRKTEISGRIDGITRQYFNSIDKIKYSGANDKVLRKFMQIYSQYVQTEMSSSRTMGLAKIVVKLGPLVSILAFFAIAGGLFGSERNVAVIISFLMAYWVFLEGMIGLTQSIWTYPFLVSEFNRIKPILDTPSENIPGVVVADELRGNIELSHVNFSYPNSNQVTLSDIDFKVKEGDFVAIVGSSGSGKSTILKVLLGLIRPDSGAVYYEGRDLHSIDLNSVRKQMGVISQNGNVFNGSILDNVVFGNDACTIEDAQKALDLAQMTEFINDYPMGIYTRISPNTISGGQQQRILLARALVGNPKVLIMDEATSALDNLTQDKIQRSLENLNITRIVVAHRLSTIIHADKIYVVDSGRIVQSGTFDELSVNSGIFKNLMKS